MTKRKRTRYLGSWTEPPAPPIDLPLTVDNLRFLLHEGTRDDSPYTHQQIVQWAVEFWVEAMRRYDRYERDTGDDPLFDRAEDIALDVDAQWDLNLYNKYRFADLPNVDVAQERLPRQWFEQWLERLDRR